MLYFQHIDRLNLCYKFSYEQKDYLIPVTLLIGHNLSREGKYVEMCFVQAIPDYRGMDLAVQMSSAEINAGMHAWLVGTVIEYFESRGIDPQKIRQYLEQYRI